VVQLAHAAGADVADALGVERCNLLALKELSFAYFGSVSYDCVRAQANRFCTRALMLALTCGRSSIR
jgi:hypothetical protein